MAKKASVTLEVLLKSAGIKATTQQVDKLQKELKQLAGQSDQTTSKMVAGSKQRKEAAKREGEVYRNQRGVFEATGRGEKDFSRMQQGLGGLVQAYATVAANVYALSSAFLVLRRAADLSSMIKSAEDFSNRFGRSVTDITQKMQKASGGALSFAEALPTINKAISAGLDTSKIEGLTVAATKAAQTFGGTANEALGRFISAAQRGRVEIIQTLGIVIQTERAYEEYATSIGKTKDALTSFDKSQAIVNATIKESENVFDGVNIDPNPFQQMLTTMVDLKDTISTFITDALTPLLNFFNKSQEAAGILLLAITKMVGSSIFPKIIEQMKGSQKQVAELRQASVRASAEASKRRIKLQLEETHKLRQLNKTELKQRIKLFEDHYAKGLVHRKAYHEALLKEDGSFNAKALALRKQDISSELSYRKRFPGRRGTGHEDISTKALNNQLNALVLTTEKVEGVSSSLDKVQTATSATDNKFRKMIYTMDDVGTSSVANAARSRNAWQRNFLKGMLITEGKVSDAIKNWKVQYRLLGHTIVSENFKIGASWIALKGLMAATSGIIVGALSQLTPFLIAGGIALAAGRFLWKKYGDSIKGITPGLREAITAQEEFSEKLQETSQRIDKYLNKTANEGIDTLREFGAALDFISGSFSDLNDKISEVIQTTAGNLYLGDFDATRERVEKLRKEINSAGNIEVPDIDINVNSMGIREATGELRSLKKAIELIKELDFTEVETEFNKLFNLASKAGLGFDDFRDKATETLTNLNKDRGLELTSHQLGVLATNLASGDFETYNQNILAFTKGNIDAAEAAYAAALGIQRFAGNASSFTGDIRANQKAIVQLNNDTLTYFENVRREAVTSSGATKEFSTKIYELTNTTQALIDAGQGENTVLTDIFGNKQELAQIKLLLGFSKDSVVSINDLNEKANEIKREYLRIGLKAQEIDRKQELAAIATAVAQERIVKSDSDRLVQIIELNAAKQTSLRLAREELENTLAAKEAEFDRLSNVKGFPQESLDALQAELDILRQQLGLAKQRETQEVTLGHIRYLNSRYLSQEKDLTSEINVLNKELQIIQNRLVLTGAERVKQVQEQGKKELEVANAELRKLNLQRASKEYLVQNTDERRRAAAELDKEIEAQEQKISLLEYENILEEQLARLKAKVDPIENAVKLKEAENKRLDIAKQLATTLKEELEISTNILSNQISVNNSQKQITQARIDEINQILKLSGKLSEERRYQLSLYEAELEYLEIQNKLYEKQLRVLEAVQPLKNQKIEIDAQLESLSIEEKINEVRRQRSYTLDSEVIRATQALNVLDKKYKLELDSLNLQKQIVQESEYASEVETAKLLVIDKQIELLQEEYLLKREIFDLDQRAAVLQNSGPIKSSLLSKEGIKTTLSYMEIKFRESALEVQNIYKRTAEGFVNTIEGGFKAAIDNLLEGGEDFKYNVREAFKAGLRETFSNLFMDNIKRAMAFAFSTIKKAFQDQNKQKDIQIELESQREKLVGQTLSELKTSTDSVVNKLGDKTLVDSASRFTIDYFPKLLIELQAIKTNTENALKCCGTAAGPASFEAPISGVGPLANLGPLQSQAPSNVTGMQPLQGVAGLLPSNSQLLPQSSDKPFDDVISALAEQTDRIVSEPTKLAGSSVESLNEAPGVLGGLSILGGVVAAVGGDQKSAIVGSIITMTAQIVSALYSSGVFGAAGGIAPGGFRALAEGGVVNKPTLGLIGEGSRNEAVVPLPNNREIPVELKNGGETVNINTTQNFDFTNSSPETIGILRAEARMIEERTFKRVFSEISKGGKYAKIVGRR